MVHGKANCRPAPAWWFAVPGSRPCRRCMLIRACSVGSDADGVLRACASPPSCSQSVAANIAGRRHSCRMPAHAACTAARLPRASARECCCLHGNGQGGAAGSGGEGKVLHWAISIHPFARREFLQPAEGPDGGVAEITKASSKPRSNKRQDIKTNDADCDRRNISTPNVIAFGVPLPRCVMALRIATALGALNWSALPTTPAYNVEGPRVKFSKPISRVGSLLNASRLSHARCSVGEAATGADT